MNFNLSFKYALNLLKQLFRAKLFIFLLKNYIPRLFLKHYSIIIYFFLEISKLLLFILLFIRKIIFNIYNFHKLKVNFVLLLIHSKFS